MAGWSKLGVGQRRPSAAGDERTQRLLRAVAEPALRHDRLPDSPVIVASLELLRNGRHYIVRARTADGAEGIAIPHRSILDDVYPLFVRSIAPLFEGRDARDVEGTLEAAYLARSFYKWQGLVYWSCIAAAELAILDLLGKVTGQPLVAYFGDGRQYSERIGVYRASGNRGNPPEEEVAFFHQQVEEIGARAVKYRLGARLSYDAASTRRDEVLIPLMRREFPDLTLYADANSSYDVPMATRIARMMEDYEYGFFEEPCAFDHYDETRAVTQAVEIPIAGGEQEFSLRHFLWQMDHGVLDLVQPDIFYFGGMTRSLRVGRAAHAVGMTCTPHISGVGLGFLYAALLAAAMPNAGPYHEYKGVEEDLPAEPIGGDFIPIDGLLGVPTGPGLGFALDPTFVRQAQPVRI